ncbi:MAG: IclR family transcriptional regulator [Burkholderiaceae bacterium]|nr:IclR family transcriptional regulator [Burkholderiaceae bacterium]
MAPDRYLRTFDVLNLLVEHKDGLRLTEIKDALKLPVSSVHNMLQTMVSAEVVSVNEDLRYSVGPRTVALALRTLQSLDIRTIARRHLQDLAKEIGDDVYLAMRVGKRVIYADRCLGTQRISLDIRLGESLFLHCTATGKLFAAYDEKLGAQAIAGRLPRLTSATITDPLKLKEEFKHIRSLGYSKSDEESVEGIVGYAVPIHDGSGNLAAAIHASVLNKQATKTHERKLLNAARECAVLVERNLGRAAQKV